MNRSIVSEEDRNAYGNMQDSPGKDIHDVAAKHFHAYLEEGRADLALLVITSLLSNAAKFTTMLEFAAKHKPLVATPEFEQAWEKKAMALVSIMESI